LLQNELTTSPVLSAAEAVQRIQPGQRVLIQPGATPHTLLCALSDRFGGLDQVEILRADADWFGPNHVTLPPVDVFFTQVSPPDATGHCSLGASLQNKRELIAHAGSTIAEVHSDLLQTYGANRVHISELSCLVQPDATDSVDAVDSVAGSPDPTELETIIARHVGSLLQDGDTLCLGYGRICQSLARAGAFSSKQHLGLHSLTVPTDLLALALAGGFPGDQKSIDTGKVVASDFQVTDQIRSGVTKHRLFELREYAYMSDPGLLTSMIKFVSIFQATAVDLTGQIAAGPVRRGPQVEAYPFQSMPFYLGSMLSPGGRSITVLPSVSADGTTSNIYPMLPIGTHVSVVRTLADYVVTEYGVAELVGRSQRERALALTAVSHPRFRDEISAGARALFWPDRT